MIWYFYQSQNKITEKKGKIKQKKEKDLPVAQAKSAHPSPAGPKGHGGLLPRPAPPSCSVECHRTSWARHVVTEELPASPWPLLAPGRAWRRHELILPLQSFL